MKTLNNVLEAGVFEISRIPIQRPRSTKKGEGDLLCAALPPERPAQVRQHHHYHHHHHHAEDVAVAVAERVDGVNALEKKDIKTASLIQPS